MIVSEHGSAMIDSGVEGFDVVQFESLESACLSLSIYIYMVVSFSPAMDLFIKYLLICCFDLISGSQQVIFLLLLLFQNSLCTFCKAMS